MTFVMNKQQIENSKLGLTSITILVHLVLLVCAFVIIVLVVVSTRRNKPGRENNCVNINITDARALAHICFQSQ